MSTQELLTFVFNAIALSFTIVAAMDFGTRLFTTCKQISRIPSSPLTQQRTSELPPVATPQKLPQLPDPWLLPSPVEESVVLIKLVKKEQNQLRLLPQAKETSTIVPPKLEDLLRGVDLDQLKLRQARKIAKVLGIAQKVNGRDQKLEFLRCQIKLKLPQETLLQLIGTDRRRQSSLAEVS